MVQSLLRLAVTITVACALAGCGSLPKQDLPATFCLDAKFSNREREMILGSVAKINRTLGRELLGGEILIYGGLVTDKNGFELRDFQDAVHVVYRLDVAPSELNAIDRSPNTDLDGTGTLSDVLLFMDAIKRDSDGQSDADQTLNHVVLHEFGHFFGLQHTKDNTAVMYPTVNGVVEYQLDDKRAFCAIYECLNPP